VPTCTALALSPYRALTRLNLELRDLKAVPGFHSWMHALMNVAQNKVRACVKGCIMAPSWMMNATFMADEWQLHPATLLAPGRKEQAVLWTPCLQCTALTGCRVSL
jgi:hypothetical protein